MTLAEWLKSSRESAGLTLEQIGDVVSRSKGAISQWENGKTEPSYWQILAIYERTNRAVDLPTLSGAPVAVGLSENAHFLNNLSKSARSLIDAVVDADRRRVPAESFSATSALLKSIPGEGDQASSNPSEKGDHVRRSHQLSKK
ncbi:helix-turn-helix domain-containing protein [Burkholderia sp. Bp9017]|uniref:helix-turn-helix domain-containing protein n=1 Tax=unclassified Burkholderia TaxID=2613784 RepID=UPI000F601D2B|nr:MULTISPECIES: helix-turn-helix transcriptional regulator [unclassified Burkholderia]RQZ31583.1 helix-turn-helix domain-containing protein [Burkholderia sp. Bp9017]RQZ37715.1 helix-turn-helix domain-containing protein [Burkholderia sp. Bp9016]